jgi:RNA polymerase sigma-70 factor (ECF subfamily)
MTESTDAAIIEAAGRGDHAAFELLYHGHLSLVYRAVLFQVRQRELAEDICQEVFLQAHRSLSELRDPQRFRVWLLRIAQNRIRNHWRDQSRRPAPPVDREPIDATVSVEGDPRATAEQLLLSQDVLKAMENLTALQRQVITLRFIVGLSAAETGGILDRSENAVHNLQHHGLAALRKLLAAPDQREAARG